MKYKKFFLQSLIIFSGSTIYADVLIDQMTYVTANLLSAQNLLASLLPKNEQKDQQTPDKDNDTIIPDTSGTVINPSLDRSTFSANAYKLALQLKTISDTTMVNTINQTVQGITQRFAITCKTIDDTTYANTQAQTIQGTTRTQAVQLKTTNDTINANTQAQTQQGITRTQAVKYKTIDDTNIKTATDQEQTNTNNSIKNANQAAIMYKAVDSYNEQKTAANQADIQEKADTAKQDPKINARRLAIRTKATRL